MVVATAVLAGLSFLIIILESSHLRSHAEDIADIHESHPILKEKLKGSLGPAGFRALKGNLKGTLKG